MTRAQAIRMAKAGWLRKKMPSLQMMAKMLGGRVQGNGHVIFWRIP